MIVLGVCFMKGITLDREDWRLLFSICIGAIVITSLAVSVSDLFNWYAVDESGLSFKIRGGVGEATLIVKKTGKAGWHEIAGATPSRFLPFSRLNLTIERAGMKGRHQREWINLPLYLKNQEGFTGELLRNAPEGHCLRTRFSSMKSNGVI